MRIGSLARPGTSPERRKRDLAVSSATPRVQVDGIANQVKGTAQDLYGQARDGASQIADDTVAAARRTASSFESSLRDTIETQPYTAVFVALGIGWLLGRMHRPL